MGVSPQETYRPPEEATKPDAASAFVGMRYFEAYSFVFDSLKWMMNLLQGTVCVLIPVIGPIVLWGYQFEIIESLHRNPRRTYPDFDFNNFVEYLKRGVWPFLVSLVVTMVPTVVLMVLFYAMMIAVGIATTAAGEEAGAPIAVVGFLLIFAVMIAASIFIGMICIPFIIRAGLAQDFGEAFNLEFAKSFFRKTWKEMILSMLFMMISSMVVGMLGFMLCFVGMYPAMVLIMLAYAHIYYQLYQTHLARGGEKIPLKPPLATAV